MGPLPIEIRNADRRDIPFITSSWLRSNRDGKMVEGINNKVYYHWHHRLMEVLLSRCATIMAVNADDPDQILGWVCAEKLDNDILCVHYLYVKQSFRRFGIARALLRTLLDAEEPTALVVTHLTAAAKKILKEQETKDPHFPSWLYNPYLLWMNLPDGWHEVSEA